MTVDNKEIRSFRQKLQKTQKQMSVLLGTSLKAIQSFEQGWRKVPVHIERYMLFLLSMKRGGIKDSRRCWDIRGCPPSMRKTCPAWEFHCGHLCCFVNGTLCRGKPQDSWSKKMKICRRCEVFASTMSR